MNSHKEKIEKEQPLEKAIETQDHATEIMDASSEAKQDADSNRSKEPEKDEKQKLEKDIQTLNDKYVRLYAEFDNYKRRTTKERLEYIRSAGKEVIVNLLPIMDDFDRAIKSIENQQDVGSIREGVKLVANKFKQVLSQQGLKEMDVQGQSFDADFHEAITNLSAPSEDMKGKVIDVVEKGYTLHDKVIRFAKVVVGV